MKKQKRFLKGERVAVHGTVMQACTTGSTYRPAQSITTSVLRVRLDGTEHDLFLPAYTIRPLATTDKLRLRFSVRGIVRDNQEPCDLHGPPGTVSVRFDDGQYDEIMSWAIRRVRVKTKAKAAAATA